MAKPLDIYQLDLGNLRSLFTIIGERIKDLENNTSSKFPPLHNKNAIEETSSSESKFETVNAKRKYKNMQTNDDTPEKVIKVSNRFEAIAPIDNDINDMCENSQANMSTNLSTNLPNSKNIKNKNQELIFERNSTAPIIIRDKSKWVNVSKLFVETKLNYIKATSLKDGIKVQPQTQEDYHKMKKLLLDKQFEFHTHVPKIEKSLKVVIKGIPVEIPNEEISAELAEIGYPTEKITRMNKKGNTPMQMVLIELNRDYKSIYNLTNLLGLNITIEPLRNKGFIIQCHRCQLFGHAQANCHAQFKCMKCGEEHSTHLCTKPKTTPPKCANCKGEHTSIFKKCPARPAPQQTDQPLTPTMKDNPWSKTLSKPITKPITNTQTRPESSQEIHNLLPAYNNSKRQKIAQSLASMLMDFHDLNPNENQLKSFNNQIMNVLKLTQ